MAERNELLEQHKKKWEERMEGRRQKEIEYMKAREKRVEDYEQQLHNIRVQDSEEYNRIKIRMETDVQVKYSTYSTKKSNFVYLKYNSLTSTRRFKRKRDLTTFI